VAVRSLLAPWPGKVGRRLTVLGPTAAAEYAAAVGAVALPVELALGGDVHGGRVAGFDPLTIEPWREARARHRRLALDAAPGKVVALRVDVADCYRSIVPRVVGRELSRLDASPGDVARVLRFLDRTAAAGISGLPVGPDPSVVLANAVLRSLDLAAGERVRCLRWYDDLLLLAPTLGDALAAEVAVAEAAATIGLRLQPGKRRLAIGPTAVRRLIVAGGAASCLP
jgi:hypothetical protein